MQPISVIARTQLLVLWSRLGAYDAAHLDTLLWQERRLFEYWAHCASIVLTEDYPIHSAMMRGYAKDDSPWARRVRQWVKDNDALRRTILATLRCRGPLLGREFLARSDQMFEQKFNGLVNLLMLPLAIWVAATGVIAELFDINDFVLHKYPAFALAMLIGIHFILRLTQWISGSRRLFSFQSPRPLASRQPKVTSPITPAGVTRRNVLIWLGSAVGGFIAGNFLAPTRWTALPTDDDIGEVYHQWSKPGNVSFVRTALNWGAQPPLFKEYADAEKLTLPPIVRHAGISLEQAMARRRSVRDYTDVPLGIAELGRLLHYSTGINDTRWGSGLRSAPSAGAQYPIETYLVVHNVTALTPGIYHYRVRDHGLDRLRAGDFRQPIIDAALGQEFFGKANVVFVLSAISQRTRWRYQERSYRYVMLEAGHIGQNIYLTVAGMGLGACAVGAFWDDDVNRLIQVDGKHEAVVYLLTVGHV